ncbi:MAG: DUF4476 domain-containing protein [Bradymonadales bacterium]|jgi:hypothetical protein
MDIKWMLPIIASALLLNACFFTQATPAQQSSSVQVRGSMSQSQGNQDYNESQEASLSANVQQSTVYVEGQPSYQAEYEDAQQVVVYYDDDAQFEPVPTSAHIGVAGVGMNTHIVTPEETVYMSTSGPNTQITVVEHNSGSGYVQDSNAYAQSYPARVMSSTEFSRFLDSVESEFNDSSKLDLVQEQTAHSPFTSAQVAKILRVFSFDNTRVQAAISLYPNVVDPQNWHTVYNEFEFDANKDEVRRSIR